jgi:hypothetical protein
MKVTRFLVSLLFLGAVTTTAFAAPVANLSWDGCTGPVNKAIAPGTQASAYVSVLGVTTTSQAYQVQVRIGNGTPVLADAWRFDPAGCQGSSFITIDHLAPAAVSKTCPSFQGILASVQVKAYLYDEPGQPGRARAVCYNAYPNNACSGCPAQGNPAATNPAQRYFLARFLFDESFGVNGPSDPGLTCGGLEIGTCLAMVSQSWLDIDGNEFALPLAQDYLTSNDASNATRCPGATPTKATTWGSLKNQYR